MRGFYFIFYDILSRCGNGDDHDDIIKIFFFSFCSTLNFVACLIF